MMIRGMLVRTLIGVACAIALGAYGGHAAAATVDSVGDTFDVTLGGNIGGEDVAGLSAMATVEVESIVGNTLVLNITLTNTSTVLWEDARVSAFGFDTNPDVVSASLESGVYRNVNLGGHFPNGFGSVDLCVINNRNNCSGGGRGGLNIGESSVLTLTLNFNAPVTSVELENFGVRYQSLTSGALGFNDASGTGTPSLPIPEPRSAALFLLGGLLIAGAVRKQVLTAS